MYLGRVAGFIAIVSGVLFPLIVFASCPPLPSKWLLLVVACWAVGLPIFLFWAVQYFFWGPGTPQPKAGRYRYVLVYCGLMTVILAAGGGYYWYECQRRITVVQVQSLLDESGPPSGSSFKEVKDWLDSHGVENEETSLDWRAWNSPTAEEAGGPEVKDAKRVLTGCYGDAYVDPVLIGDIYVFFYFDAKNQLFKTVVKSCRGFS